MSEIARHLEKAEKYLQKGRQGAALLEYFEVLRADPAHETAAQAAELALSLGHRTEAATLLRQILERQLAAASELAPATYRKLVKVAAVSPDQTEQVARFTEKTNRKESIELYETAVRGYVETGRKQNALAALESLVVLEPTVERLCNVADLAVETRDVNKAVTVLLRAGGMRALTDVDAATSLYERAHKLAPANLKAALSYAGALLVNPIPEKADRAAAALERYASGPEATPETRAVYGRALLAANRISEIEPFLGDMLQQEPDLIDSLVPLLGKMLGQNQVSAAVDLARRLEGHQHSADRLRHFSGLMREMAGEYASCGPFQEYLVELFNSTNRENDYCQTLLRLFELHFANGNYLRAGECLDRAAEVDPYESGHKRRLEMLRGKLDQSRLGVIGNRLSTAVSMEERRPASVEPAEQEHHESTMLEDLLLQAEIFLQYSLRPRAVEKLRQIRKLFPDEELKNEKLRQLCADAGIELPPVPPVVAAAGAPAPMPEYSPINNIARLTEISRNICRQTTVKSVLLTAVNEAGNHWQVSRCTAVLCTPGKPPSVALEYCAPAIKSSDVNATVTLIGLLYPLVIRYGPLSVPGDARGLDTEALRQSAFKLGGIRSMLAMPLMEGEEHIGLLLLAECGFERRWSATDTVVLKTVADQIVLAVSNARLRRLVRNLAVTDEKSGLIKRASYLDVLLSEVRRARQQSSTLTVALLHFGEASEPEPQPQDASVEQMMQQVGQLVCSHIRQTDLAVRYDLSTLALVLTDSSETSATSTLDHLRRVLSSSGVPGFSAGIAEAVVQAQYDAADIVTEAINRVESALQAAVADDVPVRALAPLYIR